MTLNQRQYRSPLSPLALVLARLDHQGAMDFGTVCDTTSIPRDLRAKLLLHLLSEHYITREGDRVRITEAGKLLASSPATPADTIPNPSPRIRARDTPSRG
jgi:hypothetical protein